MKLFLDANIIYSAAKSAKGASYGIFQLKEKLKLDLVSSKLALVEAEKNIIAKENQQVLESYHNLIKGIKVITIDSVKAKLFYIRISGCRKIWY